MEFIQCTLNYNHKFHDINELDAAIGFVDKINNLNETNSFSISILANKQGRAYNYIFKDEETALEALMNL